MAVRRINSYSGASFKINKRVWLLPHDRYPYNRVTVYRFLLPLTSRAAIDLSQQAVMPPWLATDSMRGERLYGERLTVVGKQVRALTFQTRGAF